MWTACANGIDGRRFPLCKSTALRLSVEESTKSLHSCGSWVICKAFMRSSILEQNTRLPSFMKKGSNCWWRFLYEVIVTSSSRRFHCWSLDPSNSALFLDKSKSRTRSFSSSCVILCGVDDAPQWKSGSLHADGPGEEHVGSPLSSSWCVHDGIMQWGGILHHSRLI